jgi:hypothetical protein
LAIPVLAGSAAYAVAETFHGRPALKASHSRHQDSILSSRRLRFLGSRYICWTRLYTALFWSRRNHRCRGSTSHGDADGDVSQ